MFEIETMAAINITTVNLQPYSFFLLFEWNYNSNIYFNNWI